MYIYLSFGLCLYDFQMKWCQWAFGAKRSRWQRPIVLTKSCSPPSRGQSACSFQPPRQQGGACHDFWPMGCWGGPMRVSLESVSPSDGWMSRSSWEVTKDSCSPSADPQQGRHLWTPKWIRNKLVLGSAAEMLRLLPQVPILVKCTAFHLSLPKAMVVKITCLKLFLVFFALSWERRPLKRRKKFHLGRCAFREIWLDHWERFALLLDLRLLT